MWNIRKLNLRICFSCWQGGFKSRIFHFLFFKLICEVVEPAKNVKKNIRELNLRICFDSWSGVQVPDLSLFSKSVVKWQSQLKEQRKTSGSWIFASALAVGEGSIPGFFVFFKISCQAAKPAENTKQNIRELNLCLCVSCWRCSFFKFKNFPNYFRTGIWSKTLAFFRFKSAWFCPYRQYVKYNITHVIIVICGIN